MKKGKEKYSKATYEWLKFEDKSMPLKIGVNPEVGIKVVAEQASFEIPMRYATAHSMVKMLQERKTDEVYNDLSFMLSVIQMFSDEKMRSLFFALVDMNYHLITNYKDYQPFEFKDLDAKENPQEFIENKLESIKHFNDIRDKALEPLDQVFELLTKIKEDAKSKE